MAVETEPAAGFHDRVMAAVLADVSSTATTERGRVRLLRGAALTASFVVALAMVGALLGSHKSVEKTVVPARSPAQAPAVALYRSTVDGDMGVIDRDYTTRFTCRTRTSCAAELVLLRADTKKLLADLTSIPPPAAEAAPAQRLEAAALQFMNELQTAIAAVDQPNSDFVSASSALHLNALDFAAAGVVCWPATPVQDEHGISCR